MARMPQIPQPEINARPEGRSARFESPDIEAIEAPLQAGAKLAASTGNQLEQLQAQRDEAQAKLQKVADGVTATRMAGDHAEKLRNLATQLQQQFWDTPDKFPDEFRRQSQAVTDSEISAAPNQQVALDLAQRNAVIDNQQLTLAHSWSMSRTAQKAKSDVTGLMASQVRAAQSMTTLGGLAASIQSAEQQLTPLLKNVHADPDTAVTKLRHDMAAAWVEANSPQNPAGVSIALDQKKGPLAEHLSPKEISAYQRRAASDLKGYGEIQRLQVVKEAIDHGSKAYDLFLQGQLDSKNVFQIKGSLEQKMAAVNANPNLTDEEKTHQTKVVQTQLDTLRYLDEAARKPGRFDAAFDQERQTKIFNAFAALGKPGDKTPKDLLKIVQLRHDLAETQADRAISDSRAQTINKALTQMTGKAMSQETKNTGWGVSFLGFGGRSPQQAGNVVLNSYFKGDNKAFGKLTPEQQNDARFAYLEQIVEAQEAGRNVDAKAAETMAFNAIKHVAGRAPLTGMGQ